MKILFLITFILFLNTSCQRRNDVIHPKVGNIVEATYGLGTIESEDVFIAKAAIISSISEFFVKEGDDVKKGQKLFRTDEDMVRVAPFNGRVTEISVSVKENLFPQTAILTIHNLENLFLSVSLEQQAAMRIKKGMNAEISFEFFRQNKIIGTVTSIYPHKNEFVAKVKVNNWPSGVLPGMTADVAFKMNEKQNVVLVPQKSIINGIISYKREGKKFKEKAEVGLVDMEYCELLSPKLNESDELILN